MGPARLQGALVQRLLQLLALVFSTAATLLVFGNWLKVAGNWDTWELTLCAYLSLKKEGHDRVTEATVQTRVTVLNWVFQMLNVVPSKGFVMKLSDMSLDHVLEPTRLMTMSTSSNQRCLGYFMQQDNPKPREPQRSVIERPQTSHSSFPWATCFGDR